jgi:hypothetical protein
MAKAWLARVTLEELFTHPLLFNVPASPVQRAICRVAEGRPLGALWDDNDVRSVFRDRRPFGRPKGLAVVAGIRTGKSLLAAAMCVHAALRADLSVCGPGEVPRGAIYSTSLDNAQVIYDHLSGRMSASAVLRSVLLSDPASSRSRLLIEHPSGRPVEICTLAGKRAGASGVARWMVAALFDEYARMVGDEADGVVNYKDTLRAVRLRIVPNGYLVSTSSPWAPYGPAYDHVENHWGLPTADLAVVRAKAFEMNPAYWTPERCEEAKKNPDEYRTDVLCEFLAPEAALLLPEHVEAAQRVEGGDVPRVAGAHYTAAMDPATRGNGWTLVVATRDNRMRRIVAVREWRGSSAAPLDPKLVLDEIAALLRVYGINAIDTDQWSGDALAALAREAKYFTPAGPAHYPLRLHLWRMNDREKTERYLDLRLMLATGTLELPRHGTLAQDLVRLKKRITTNGASIVLPETSDGRHCDFAPALMLAMSRYLDDLPAIDADPFGSEVARMRAASERRYLPQQDDEL